MRKAVSPLSRLTSVVQRHGVPRVVRRIGGRAADAVLSRATREAGGRAQAKAVLLFAAVLALDSADKATVGSVAKPLREAMGISNIKLGLLASITSIVGAAGTLAFGVYVDRVNRSRLLAGAIAMWALAMLASALSNSYLMLVGSRVFLGVMTAAAGPAIASMTGDLFPARLRGRIYGLILTGELAGTGFGFVAAGSLATLSWRAGFFVLVLPAVLLAPALWRMPEPERGAQAAGAAPGEGCPPDGDGEIPPGCDPVLSEAIAESDAEPQEELVVDVDVRELPLWRAVRYVVRIKTNLLLIIASACGYYFFAGISTFGVEFVRDQYGVGQATASSFTILLGAGAICGVLVSGRVSDGLLARGRVSARVEVAVVALAVTVVIFVPALVTRVLYEALPLLVGAAFALGALNPPLDAARLDIVPSGLWGRAEGVRSVLRTGAQAAAPVAFGALADQVFGGGRSGLQDAFLFMLAPLAISAVIGLFAIRTYPADVATAMASSQASGAAQRRALDRHGSRTGAPRSG